MPYDLDTRTARARGVRRGASRRTSLRDGVAELMSGAPLVEPALRDELRRLVASTHDPVAALWVAYTGGRTA